MNGLLNVRVHLHHLMIQVRMISDHNLGVPCCCNKYCVDTTAERCSEHVADLETDKESERDNDGSKSTISVIRGLCEYQVEVRKQGASIPHECRTQAENRSDQTFVDESIDAPVFDHPGIQVST